MIEMYLVDGRRVGRDECRRLFDRPLPTRMRDVLARAHGPRLLDVGSYDGAFLAAVARDHPDVDAIAIDYDQENIRIGRFLHPELADSLIEASVYELPFTDGTFDCVTFQEVIEHLEGAAAAVKELNRVLAVGGTLLVTTPNAHYWRDAIAQIRADLGARVHRRPPRLQSATYFVESEWNRHIYSWSPATLLTLLEVNGFEYVWHGYANDSETWWGRALTTLVPSLAAVIVLEVVKRERAGSRVV